MSWQDRGVSLPLGLRRLRGRFSRRLQLLRADFDRLRRGLSFVEPDYAMAGAFQWPLDREERAVRTRDHVVDAV